MLRHQNPENPTKPKSSSSSSSHSQIYPSPNSSWRIRIKQTQLISQASTILLQRHSKLWAPLLKPLKLSSDFTPSLFHQILNRIQNHPKTSFTFFQWAQKTLDFKPDPIAQCRMVRILFGSGLPELGRPVLDSVAQNHPPAKVVPLLIQSQNFADVGSISPVLNSAIDFYCSKKMHLQGLEVYRMGKPYGFALSVGTCNTVLNSLCDVNEYRLAWCFYASVVRDWISGDEFTWYAIARVLYKCGKFERISRLLDMGIHNLEMFDLLIDGYSRKGDFVAAFDHLNILCSKGTEPGFSTYSSFLNGACKFQNEKVIETVMSSMVEKGYVLEFPLPASDYDLMIGKLCDLEKTFAMDMFFKRARDEKIQLQHDTYERMLRALSSEKDCLEGAIELYNTMQAENISASKNCYGELVMSLCKENPSQKVNKLLVDLIGRGYICATSELSAHVSKQCEQGRWREAEELFDLLLSKGCLLDSISCGSLMRHYCSIRQIDKAINVHDKIVGLNGYLGTPTYNVLLAALFKKRRVEEAVKVFDYMRACERLESDSFVVMIRGLGNENELRKAMELHDEMLELGLKPDQRMYKRLISCFR